MRPRAAFEGALQNEFGPAADERRRRVRERTLQDPTLMLPVMTTLVGPDQIPADAFEEPIRRQVLGEAS